jgi:hypothetical protein
MTRAETNTELQTIKSVLDVPLLPAGGVFESCVEGLADKRLVSQAHPISIDRIGGPGTAKYRKCYWNTTG